LNNKETFVGNRKIWQRKTKKTNASHQKRIILLENKKVNLTNLAVIKEQSYFVI